jgi:hypothetical protein
MTVVAVDDVVHIDELCPSGGTHRVTYVDAFDGSSRQVHRAVSCSRCGDVSESDYGELPSDVRDVVVAMHGRWEVSTKASDRIRLISAVRDLLGLSLDQARGRVGLDGALFRGTRAEAQHFAFQLLERGVDPLTIVVRLASVKA